MNHPEMFPNLKNPLADLKWTPREMDALLDAYLEGAHPDRLAVEFKRNPKAIRRKLQHLHYNEKNLTLTYRPFKRISREGKKLSQNEIQLIHCHQERGLPIEKTAEILQRPLGELLEYLRKEKPASQQRVGLSRLNARLARVQQAPVQHGPSNV